MICSDFNSFKRRILGERTVYDAPGIFIDTLYGSCSTFPSTLTLNYDNHTIPWGNHREVTFPTNGSNLSIIWYVN